MAWIRPAGKWLIAQGVKPADFNSYGARRGNHEVMMRGTFANIRLRNQLAPGTEGGWTVHQPDGEKMSIYDASMKYQKEGMPLIVLGGKEYGSGSSRDWAAKGTVLLGVRAVIAESYERIHRSNLLGMGVLPLQYKAGESAQSLGLTGFEEYTIDGVAKLAPGLTVEVRARDAQAKMPPEIPPVQAATTSTADAPPQDARTTAERIEIVGECQVTRALHRPVSVCALSADAQGRHHQGDRASAR